MSNLEIIVFGIILLVVLVLIVLLIWENFTLLTNTKKLDKLLKEIENLGKKK